MKKYLCNLAVVLTLFLMSFQSYAASQIDNIGYNLSYREISESLNKIEQLMRAENPDINELVDKISYFNYTLNDLNESRKSINERVKSTEKKIEALGVVDDNLPEAKIIAQKRAEYRQILSDEKTRISEIDLLRTRIEEINMRIFDMRNQKLWGNLFHSEGVLIRPSVFWKSNQELWNFGVDIIKSPFIWYSELTEAQQKDVGENLSTLFIIITLISILGYYSRRFVIKHWGYRADVESPRLGRKILAAFAVWCAYGIIPTAIIGFCLYWIVESTLLTKGFFGVVLSSALYYLLYIIMGRASFRVVFTPYNERWRLINMPTDKAKKLIRAIYFTIVIVGLFSFLQHIVISKNYSLELLSYLFAISSSIKAFCLLLIAYIYFVPEQVEEVVEEEGEENINENDGQTFKLGMLISLFSLFIVGLSLFGYSRLASFIIDHTIITAIVIAVYSILRRLVYDMVQHILLMGLWVKTFRMRRMFLRKIDFWFGIIAEPILMLLLVAILLLIWGVPFDVLQTVTYRAISGFKVGGVEISLISIFWGIIAFVICLWIIKFIRYRIEFRLLEKTNIDAGTKHSLASGFAYIGYVLSGLLSIAIMGGNLTNIALIAGALSVGVGLGLQDIVNNFVSGIVMLFERPIKVGDWVVINGEEGQIKQINIRSTEIETFNRASVIIPNSKVLSNSVTNLTHQNNWVRYSITIGVAYGTDVELVKRVLLECAATHSRVVKKPAPYVLFKDFGESSLDFELRFYVNDIWNGWSAPSDIRYIINRRFIEEGIEIPFKQMVIHQGSTVAQQTEAQFYAKKKEDKDVD